MAKKRTKADRLQRQTEQPEKRVERDPDEVEDSGGPPTLLLDGMRAPVK